MTQRKRGRKRRATKRIAPVMALAWFKPEQWESLKAESADRERLEETYELWLEAAEATVEQLAAEGVVVERIEVDLDELVAWCRENSLTLDASARANFAAEKLRSSYDAQEPPGQEP
jgi:hypothetical protein